MKQFLFVVIIISLMLVFSSCAQEPLIEEDFHYTDIEHPDLSEEDNQIYLINLERLFSKIPDNQVFNDEVTYFDSEIYGEEYRSDYLGNVGEIIDSPEKAVRQYILYNMRLHDKTYILQRPYTVQYDAAKKIWLITASPDYLVGRSGSGINFMIAENGDVLSLWEYSGYLQEKEDGYFSILNYDDMICSDGFSCTDTNPVEINTAREAAEKFEEIFGKSVIEQRPYIVSYDPVAEYWMVVGNTDYLEDACGGSAYAIFSRDGKGEMYVFHTE